MTSYCRSIVTMALSRVVSETFNVEKCRDLEILVRGHSGSSKMLSFDRSCMVSYFLLVFFSNFVPKHTVFEIFAFSNRFSRLDTIPAVIQYRL